MSASQPRLFAVPWRPTTAFWITCGAILAVFVILTVTTVIATTVVYTPQAAVRQYFGALKRHDSTALLRLEHGLQPQSYTLKAIQSQDYRSPEDLRIGKITNLDDEHRSIAISYTINGKPFNSTISVVKNDKRNAAGFYSWHPTDTMGGIALQSALYAGPKINGQPLPQNTDALPALLPGSYRVTSADNPLADIPAITVAVPAGAEGEAKLAPKLKPDAVSKITPQVTKYIDHCIAEMNAQEVDDNCSFLDDAEVFGPTIKVHNYPKIALAIGDEGVLVSTPTPGSVTVSSEYGDDETKNISVAGFAYVDSKNNVIFSPAG